MIVGIVLLAICGTACLHLLLPRDDGIDLEWSDVELPPKPKRDRAAERAERAAAAAEAEGAGGKRRPKGGYSEYDNAGYCRSRQPPNSFVARFWKRLETDPRDAPLAVRADGMGGPSGAAFISVMSAQQMALNMTPDAPVFGPGSGDEGTSATVPLLLTAPVLRELPKQRGGLLMRLLLEGDVPEGVTPRLEIPEEYTALTSETDKKRSEDGKTGWSFTTCAVVGTSGLLKGSGLGKEIDRHRAVFRLDMAPTGGFEADVGSKTTFDVAGAGELRRLMPAEDLMGREDEDDVEEEEEDAGPSAKQQRRAKRNKAGTVGDLAAAKERGSRLVLYELFNRAALRGTYPPLLRAWGKDRSALLSPKLVIHILQVWDRLTGAMDAAASGGGGEDSGVGGGGDSNKKGADKGGASSNVPAGAFKGFPRASSAAVGGLLALQMCDKVDLYGFAPPLAVMVRTGARAFTSVAIPLNIPPDATFTAPRVAHSN